MKVKGLLAAALCAGALGAGAAEPGWLHIQVVESGGKGGKVNINLPLGVLDVALDAVPEEHIKTGRIKLNHSKVDAADLRRMWSELKKAGDTEFVTVEEKDESVRIEKRGERVQVRVTDNAKKAEKVRLDVPVSVVDALLSGEGDRLNLRAAIEELRRTSNGEIMNVDDGDSRVRIWID